MQRLQQVTSADASMSALLDAGVTSAYQVARQDKASFVADHLQALGADEAARVHDRSREIYNATLNVAMLYLTARNGFQLGAMQTPGAGGAAAEGGQILRSQPLGASAANADDIIAYPTLEQLFGAMDFCSCDECRSIFSTGGLPGRPASVSRQCRRRQAQCPGRAAGAASGYPAPPADV